MSRITFTIFPYGDFCDSEYKSIFFNIELFKNNVLDDDELENIWVVIGTFNGNPISCFILSELTKFDAFLTHFITNNSYEYFNDTLQEIITFVASKGYRFLHLNLDLENGELVNFFEKNGFIVQNDKRYVRNEYQLTLDLEKN